MKKTLLERAGGDFRNVVVLTNRDTFSGFAHMPFLSMQ